MRDPVGIRLEEARWYLDALLKAPLNDLAQSGVAHFSTYLTFLNVATPELPAFRNRSALFEVMSFDLAVRQILHFLIVRLP